MAETNGKVTLVNRVAQWVALLGLFVYVLNVGQWVGAADEKFRDADNVEATQRIILLQLNTVAVKQGTIEDAVEDNEKAIEASKQEVLAAIAAIKD